MTRRILTSLLLGAGASIALPAFAQDSALPAPEPVIPYDLSVAGEGVSERWREEYEPQGVSALGGTLRADVFTGLGYTDNVFGTETGEVGDAFGSVRPRVELRLGEDDTFLSIRSAADIRRHFDYSRANETGLSIDADGSASIGAGTVLQGGALARRAYERPSSGSFPLAALARIEFDEIAGYARIIRSGSQLRLLGAVDAAQFNFKDALPAFGGVPVSQDDRDRTVYRGSARAEWALSGGISTFVEGAYSQLDYRRDMRLDTTENLDGNRWETKAGLLLSSGKLRGGLGLGYSRRTYDALSYESISGMTADVSVQYFATGLTTFNLAARRSIEEGGDADAGSFLQNSIEAGVDHELLRNLILGLRAQYARSDYRVVDRDDDILSASGTARFLLSRYLEITSELTFVDRSSTGAVAGPRFDALYGLVGATLRF